MTRDFYLSIKRDLLHKRGAGPHPFPPPTLLPYAPAGR